MQKRRNEPNRTVQIIKASEARQQWSQTLNRVFRGETRVLVEKSGIPVVAIISADDLERFTEWEAQHQQQFSALEATWEAFKDLPDEDLEREVERSVIEARRIRRKQEPKQK